MKVKILFYKAKKKKTLNTAVAQYSTANCKIKKRMQQKTQSTQVHYWSCDPGHQTQDLIYITKDVYPGQIAEEVMFRIMDQSLLNLRLLALPVQKDSDYILSITT